MIILTANGQQHKKDMNTISIDMIALHDCHFPLILQNRFNHLHQKILIMLHDCKAITYSFHDRPEIYH